MTEKTFNKVLKNWTALPEDIKKMILGDVWCVQCRKVVTMRDYSIVSEDRDAILRGFCNVCGHKITRVVEDCDRLINFDKENHGKQKR